MGYKKLSVFPDPVPVATMVGRGAVYVYDFAKNAHPGMEEKERGYWRDVGTLDSYFEASMDLGADGFQTFRYIVLPNLATALLAGGMLAFALSFDEVIVTTFTAGQQSTLPIWIFSQLTRPRDRPVTNVVAFLVVSITAIPILYAHFLSQRSGDTAE